MIRIRLFFVRRVWGRLVEVELCGFLGLDWSVVRRFWEIRRTWGDRVFSFLFVRCVRSLFLLLFFCGLRRVFSNSS